MKNLRSEIEKTLIDNFDLLEDTTDALESLFKERANAIIGEDEETKTEMEGNIYTNSVAGLRNKFRQSQRELLKDESK